MAAESGEIHTKPHRDGFYVYIDNIIALTVNTYKDRNDNLRASIMPFEMTYLDAGEYKDFKRALKLAESILKKCGWRIEEVEDWE